MTAAEIAASLTEAQKRALHDLSRIDLVGLRPGHNLIEDVCYERPCNMGFDARALDDIHRLGLASAERAEGFILVDGGPHPEVGELEATHIYRITDTGRAILTSEASRDER